MDVKANTIVQNPPKKKKKQLLASYCWASLILRDFTVLSDDRIKLVLVPTQGGSVLLVYSAMFHENNYRIRVKSQFSDFASLTGGKSKCGAKLEKIRWTTEPCCCLIRFRLRITTISCLFDSAAHQKSQIKNQDVCYHELIRKKSQLNSDRMAQQWALRWQLPVLQHVSRESSPPNSIMSAPIYIESATENATLERLILRGLIETVY